MIASPTHYLFTLNLKFTTHDGMKGLLADFPHAEELITFSKTYDFFEDTVDAAGEMMKQLAESLEKQGCGKFGVSSECNPDLMEIELEDGTTDEDIAEIDPEEWIEGEMMKLWVYEVTDEESPNPVALAQIIQQQGAPRLVS